MKCCPYQPKGKSGELYTFEAHDLEPFSEIGAGVYLIMKTIEGQVPYPESIIYIGKTNDFSSCMENHPKLDCIKKNSGKFIAITRCADETQEKILKDLLPVINPICNE